jgi:hypothetical protein
MKKSFLIGSDAHISMKKAQEKGYTVIKGLVPASRIFLNHYRRIGEYTDK